MFTTLFKKNTISSNVNPFFSRMSEWSSDIMYIKCIVIKLQNIKSILYSLHPIVFQAITKELPKNIKQCTNTNPNLMLKYDFEFFFLNKLTKSVKATIKN